LQNIAYKWQSGVNSPYFGKKGTNCDRSNITWRLLFQ